GWVLKNTPASSRSLAVSATASSLGRKTPKISADAVKTDEMMRFMVILLVRGVIAWRSGLSACQNAQDITIPTGRLQPCSWSDVYAARAHFDRSAGGKMKAVRSHDNRTKG